MDATRIDTDERRNMEKMDPLLDEESCGTNAQDSRMAQVQHTTKRAWAVTALAVIFLVALGNMISGTGLCNASVLPTSAQSPGHTLAKYAVAAAAPLLRVFQVYPPVLTPSAGGAVLTDGSASQASGGTSGCVVTQTLMKYSFGNSYGQPFVGPYVPPSCSFNRVTFNFTVTSAGRQFDRLAVAYFGDTELWRTSTAEPTKDGIIWTYVKDMTSYLSLFKEKQDLIFDLGNIINDIYTGPFNTTLQATFFTADDTVQPADKIVPISARLGSKKMPSAWQYPTNASNSVTLPRNIQRAVFSVSATGQSAEEFWYSNVLSSDVNTFGPDAGLLPYSPFRETQIYIDDKLAGVAWPFPIIFTGGIVPGLWRPIVGIDAYDLREDEIDITPWLPLLCDGAPHRFEIRVAGISDDGHHHGQLTNTVGTYWVLTGKIFLWLDNAHPKAITTGTPPRLSVPAPSISLASVTGKTIKGVNQTLTYDVNVTRNLAITSTIRTAAGSRPAAWIQHLTYSNHGVFSAFGTTQYTKQTSSGFDTAIPGPYARHFTYPITVNTSYIQSATTSDITIDAVLSRGQDIQVLGVPVFPTGLQSFAAAQGKTSPSFQGSELRTSQNGSAHYQSTNNNAASSSYGSTEQNMIFAGIRTDNVESAAANGQFPSIQGSGELYRRHVLAVNGSVVSDDESLLGRPFGGVRSSSVTSEVSGDFAGGDGVRDLIGHGPPS